jgi:two-component system response regulator YesN
MVLNHIEDNFHRECLAGDMAELLNLSIPRFCHLFKSETGTSFRSYLKRLRLEKAKHLLETTYLSVKEIMAGVGYNDESYFVRTFKSIYHVPPLQYRKNFLAGKLLPRPGH